MKKNQRTLAKAEHYLNKYYGDSSVYYIELKRSYKEYKEKEEIDRETNDLYVDHIDELCNFLRQKNQANFLISLMLMFSIFIVFVAIYTSYKYYTLSDDIKKNILRFNQSTTLVVNYKNIDNFDANILSDDENYIYLTPLSLSLMAKSDSLEAYKVHYDIYIIEENEGIDPNTLLSKDAFLYNVTSKNRNNGIKALKNNLVENGKILVFSGEVMTNVKEEIDIRMWIDSNTNIDYINKKYKFKIYVDGYVV